MFLAQCKSILCFSLLIFASHASANETENSKLQFSGFATIGAVISDSDQYGYRKNIASDEAVYSGEIDFKQHSLLGLQANWLISPKFDAVYQSVLRDLPEPSLDRYTTLAFLRYEVNTNWNVRVGRIAPDLFLLTEYRDVDFSYIWATAPNEVYGIIPFRSIDGIDVSYKQRAFGGVLKAKLFTGSSSVESLGQSVVVNVQIENILGFALSIDQTDWTVQAKYSQFKFAKELLGYTVLAEYISQTPDFLWPNSQTFAQSILMKGIATNYYSVGGQYRWKNWSASTELSYVQQIKANKPNIISGYAALSYQLNTHQFYGIYAFTESNPYIFDEPGVNEDALKELIQGTTELLNFLSTSRHTTSLGWRWDMTNNIASSLQWSYAKLDEGSRSLWLNKSENSSAENVNTFLLTLSMVF